MSDKCLSNVSTTGDHHSALCRRMHMRNVRRSRSKLVEIESCIDRNSRNQTLHTSYKVSVNDVARDLGNASTWLEWLGCQWRSGHAYR